MEEPLPGEFIKITRLARMCDECVADFMNSVTLGVLEACRALSPQFGSTKWKSYSQLCVVLKAPHVWFRWRTTLALVDIICRPGWEMWEGTLSNLAPRRRVNQRHQNTPSADSYPQSHCGCPVFWNRLACQSQIDGDGSEDVQSLGSFAISRGGMIGFFGGVLVRDLARGMGRVKVAS